MRLKKLLRVADPDSLAECLQVVTAAQLGPQVQEQVQAMQAAAEVLQGAVQRVQQHQQAAGADEAEGPVPSGLQEGLLAGLKGVEQLCKPGEQAGCGPSWSAC